METGWTQAIFLIDHRQQILALFVYTDGTLTICLLSRHIPLHSNHPDSSSLTFSSILMSILSCLLRIYFSFWHCFDFLSGHLIEEPWQRNHLNLCHTFGCLRNSYSWYSRQSSVCFDSRFCPSSIGSLYSVAACVASRQYRWIHSVLVG